MRRAICFAVLSLLLLSMQWLGHVHPIEHFARSAYQAQDSTLSTSQGNVDCIECALLAGGFNAVHAQVVSIPLGVAVAGAVAFPMQVRAADRLAWYSSRAPPDLV